jgi:hypothetical protein
MTGDVSRPPAYAIVHCEGRRCVEVADFADLVDDPPTEAAAVAFLEDLAGRFRAAGALGRVVLVDRSRGDAVATRRVWP